MSPQKINMMQIYLATCLFLIGPWPGTSAAMTADKEQPITIEADRVDIDDKKGVSIYQGKVRVTQGSMVLTADTVTTYAVGDKKTKQRELDKITAVAAPAHFRQLLDTKDPKTSKNEEMRGKAQRIDYFAREERLVLQGSSHLWKEGDEFSGNIIEYDIAQEAVKAAMGNVGGQAGEAPQERVHAVIQPRRKKDGKIP